VSDPVLALFAAGACAGLLLCVLLERAWAAFRAWVAR
jgi:hypothetical protein